MFKYLNLCITRQDFNETVLPCFYCFSGLNWVTPPCSMYLLTLFDTWTMYLLTWFDFAVGVEALFPRWHPRQKQCQTLQKGIIEGRPALNKQIQDCTCTTRDLTWEALTGLFTDHGFPNAGTEEELPESKEAGCQGAPEHAVRLLGGGAGWLAQGPGHPQELDQAVVCAEAGPAGALQERETEGRGRWRPWRRQGLPQGRSIREV